MWFLLLPTIQIVDSRNYQEFSESHKFQAKFERQKIVNSIISNRRNGEVNEKLEFWLRFLQRGKGSIQFGIDNFKIELSNIFSYSGFKTTDKTHFFQGLSQLEEPKLVFSLTDNSYKCIHPLKGLKSYQPLDCSFGSEIGNQSIIKLAIIFPDKGFDRLINHLNDLKRTILHKSEQEYLIEYSGFDSIYRKYIDIPNNKSSRLCVSINEQEIISKSHIEFYDIIKRKIDYFETIKGEFDVLIIYFPEAWKQLRELKTESTYFDLHDSVKIYCAKKNIKVQFIEDKSIKYFDQAKVKWWLSLGLYVKANGVPWKSYTTDSNTAFVGLGYALKRSNNNDKVVMGYSQIFDSAGQGLRFLLQPIEKPVYRGKNPFMSKEDARRMVLKLKESYFKTDPNSKLEKLVIHKTTHFTRDEMEGIAQALEGIPNVELLQIQQSCFWQGIRGNLILKEGRWVPKNGKKRYEVHPYPISRGKVLQLDNFSFLIWTHGSIEHDEIAGRNRNYYQGGRGIPTPLLIRRFRGQDSIEVTAREILMLTKMNWNSGNLYKNLPVTLDFSKALSRMAKQDETLNNITYDFRFFM